MRDAFLLWVLEVCLQFAQPCVKLNCPPNWVDAPVSLGVPGESPSDLFLYSGLWSDCCILFLTTRETSHSSNIPTPPKKEKWNTCVKVLWRNTYYWICSSEQNFFKKIDFWERGRGRERETSTCSTYLCIHGSFLCAPWPGVEPVTLVYWPNALANWATRPRQWRMLFKKQLKFLALFYSQQLILVYFYLLNLVSI